MRPSVITTADLPRGTDVIVDVACDRSATDIAPVLTTANSTVCDLQSLVRTGDLTPIIDASLIIVAAHTQSGDASDALVSNLRALLPAVSIFVCTRRADRGHLQICEYARAGVDDLFLVDTPAELALLLHEVQSRIAAPPPLRALNEVSAAAPSRGRMIALWCVRNGYRRHTLGSVTTWFGVDPKTVNRHCAKGGFVNASALLRSGRLFHLQEIRRRERFSTDEAARRLGFADAKALDVFRGRARRSGLPATFRAPQQPAGRQPR